MHHREQVSQFKLEQSRHLEDLDQTAKKIVDAIVEKQDVFQEAHREIIQGVSLLYYPLTIMLNVFLSAASAACC